jgi:hypothetical protein
MKGQYILLQKNNEQLDLALSHTSGILENYKASNSFKIGNSLLFPIRLFLSLIKRQRS